MVIDESMSAEEAELNEAIENVLTSPSRKKLVVAGPGTGKTTLFKQMLEIATGEHTLRLVLTFINNLKDDLKKELSGLAEVYTLHSYCLGLMYRHTALRDHLSSSFLCCPGLRSLIREDWEYINKCAAPHFIREMRNIEEENRISFYLSRGEYYDAVDFDDTVYRVYLGLTNSSIDLNSYDLILIDEYQDFNRLEAAIIDFLAQESPIMIVGDDDQALYSQLRDSSWAYIRSLHQSGEYEIFELPFCMRCPKVIVDAVSDIILHARQLRRLEDRIPKPYKYFPPVKGADSVHYPKIAVIETTVQRENANYMGRYIAKAITKIPSDEIEAALNGGYPAVLVIAVRPYRDQIIRHLESAGYDVDARRDPAYNLNLERGLSILKENHESNLGWRIVLNGEKQSSIVDTISKTADGEHRLIDILPESFRNRVLADVEDYKPPEEVLVDGQQTEEPVVPLPVRVTSFEGAKGLQAQHVFIAGLHDYELPHDPSSIQDLEICKFIVGLTRTRKMCSIIYTNYFAGRRKSPSSFISWIDSDRLEHITVNAAYWGI